MTAQPEVTMRSPHTLDGADAWTAVLTCPHNPADRTRSCAMWDSDCIEERCGHWSEDAGEDFRDTCPLIGCGGQEVWAYDGMDALDGGPSAADVTAALPLDLDVTWDDHEERFLLRTVSRD